MKKLNVIAIDLAKNVFQVCKTDYLGTVFFNKTMSRNALKELLVKEKVSVVAMESCSGAHYFARHAKENGHTVKSISARSVKAFRQGQKTDANDALAIAVAARQPHIKLSRVITLEEQCLQSMECMRDLLVKQKVSLSNQLRSILLDLGYAIPQGDSQLKQSIPGILEDAENDLSIPFRSVLSCLWQRFLKTIEEIADVEKTLFREVRQDDTCQRLQALEGVGPVGAIALRIVLSNPEHFKNGREASACVGVTPVQHSSGGKEKIGSISRLSGHNKLRSHLFKGALAVIRSLEKRPCRTPKEVWLKDLVARRGKKVAAIALANKNVRTAYALIKQNKEYKPQLLIAA